MKDELFDVSKVTDHIPPDGEFKGKWHGYTVKFNAYGAEFEAKANQGVRGWADCVVTVTDGNCTVET